ncbi:MAG: hypothetical protein QW510_04470 [Candidatus Bathyarchaeia archaeon]
MPAISIDTFFACSLMVLLVLSAMTATARILQPLINMPINVEVAQRLGEIAKRILLYTGKPVDWGQNAQTIPEEFGLAEAGAVSPYALDVDKVSRLNRENAYCLSYVQIFTSLKAADLSFRIEIKPVFNVRLNPTAIFEGSNETVYAFEVASEKEDGALVSTILRTYVLAESLLQTNDIQNFGGRTSFNITIPNTLPSPAVLIVFAKSMYNNRATSYAVYSLAHLSEPPRGAFLRLSPINHTLTVASTSSEAILRRVYALTFNSLWQLTQTGSNSFRIPVSSDVSPTVLVVFGTNATQPFVEWTVYPQVPIQTGVDFASLQSVSDVYAYEHLVSIGNGLYQCTIFLGGSKT